MPPWPPCTGWCCRGRRSGCSGATLRVSAYAPPGHYCRHRSTGRREGSRLYLVPDWGPCPHLLSIPAAPAAGQAAIAALVQQILAAKAADPAADTAAPEAAVDAAVAALYGVGLPGAVVG